MKPWFKNVTPHKDIQEGHLDESVFAANLAEVAAGTGREIYNNPEIFFSKTYFTAGLKNIARRMVQGLNGGQDAENRVISLQTGFGGGKTHTLISLYHLAKWGKKAIHNEHTKELLAATGEPRFDTARIAVFTNTTNDPAQGRSVEGVTLRTIWGELAYQLGGREAYEIVRINDEQRIAPKGLFKQVLAHCKPALILIDELADYCVSASAVKVEASNLSDQTVSFMQELTEAVSGTDQCVLIATLPASAQELAALEISTQILTALESRISRIGANLKPVEDDEIFEVVRRRLFEDLGNPLEIEEVVSAYSSLYQNLKKELPPHALRSEYRERMKKSYPFHPELIDMFRLRWAGNPYFQRTRGILRILAAIVSDLWQRQNSLTGSPYLIHTSDVVLSNVESLTSQITLLYGANWQSVISSDVSGSASNAFRIDADVRELGQHQIAQGVATTILLATFESHGQRRGISVEELKLCMVKPESFNHNNINGALDRLEAQSHYLYYSALGPKRYWFETTPNVNILINQAKGNISNNEVYSEILNRLKLKANGIRDFNVLVDPASDLPEQKDLTLIILHPRFFVKPNKELNPETKRFIETLATKKGNQERIYRNTFLFLAASESGLVKLMDDVRNFLACKKINEEYQVQLTDAQKSDLRKRIDEASRQVESGLVSAYSVIMKYSVKNDMEILVVKQFKDMLDVQINENVTRLLKDEEWLLESVGLNTLERHNLLPTPDNPIKVKDVYEAFLRFDDKPMIKNKQAIATSLQRYCINGDLCIASGNGKDFSRYYFKEDIPYFEVDDINFWLLNKSSVPSINVNQRVENIPVATPIPEPAAIHAKEPNTTTTTTEAKQSGITINYRSYRSISVSGKVPIENYHQIFESFIKPLAHNDIEIEVKITGKSTQDKPLTENSEVYRIVKESAKQLGMEFIEEQEGNV